VSVKRRKAIKSRAPQGEQSEGPPQMEPGELERRQRGALFSGGAWAQQVPFSPSQQLAARLIWLLSCRVSAFAIEFALIGLLSATASFTVSLVCSSVWPNFEQRARLRAASLQLQFFLSLC